MFYENRQDLDFGDVERCSACVRKASCGIIRRYSAGKHRYGRGGKGKPPRHTHLSGKRNIAIQLFLIFSTNPDSIQLALLKIPGDLGILTEYEAIFRRGRCLLQPASLTPETPRSF